MKNKEKLKNCKTCGDIINEENPEYILGCDTFPCAFYYLEKRIRKLELSKKRRETK